MDTPTELRARVLLFDMDGTLVDSAEVVEACWRRFASRHGLDAEAILAVSSGRPTIEVIEQFATPGMDPAAETSRIEDEEMDRTEGIREVRGARRLLESLEPGRWAVVTSAPRELARRRLAAAGLPVPAVLVGADDVSAGKPDPQGYRMAAKTLGSAAGEAVVFEDAEAGLLAGRAAGAATVVVGDYAGEAAAGLPRLADLAGATVVADDEELLVRL